MVVSSILAHPLDEDVDTAPEPDREPDDLSRLREAPERADDAAHAGRRVVDLVDDLARAPQLSRRFLGQPARVDGEAPRFGRDRAELALDDAEHGARAIERAPRAQ